MGSPALSITRTAVLVIAVAMTLTACGGTKTVNDGPTNTSRTSGLVHPVPIEGRPSLESMLKNYRAVERDVIDALTQKYGDLGWHQPDGDSDISSDCGPDSHYAQVGLRTWVGTKNPPKGVSDEVKALVTDVLKKHGFTHFQVMNQSATDLDMFGYDKYDTRLEVGYDKRPIVGTDMGCFKWANPNDSF